MAIRRNFLIFHVILILIGIPLHGWGFESDRLRPAVNNLVHSLQKMNQAQYAVMIGDFLPMEKLSADLSDEIKDYLASRLTKEQVMTVSSTDKTKAILEEIKLSYQGFIDNPTKKKLGDFTNANGILFGTYLIRDNRLMIFARLVDIPTGEIIWADSSYPLEDKSTYLTAFMQNLKKNRIESIGVLPFINIAQKDAVQMNSLSEVVITYLKKIPRLKVYERNNIDELLVLQKQSLRDINDSKNVFNLVPVQALLKGYYYYNRIRDFDVALELVDTQTSKILWAEKISHPQMNSREYEKTLENWIKISGYQKIKPNESFIIKTENTQDEMRSLQQLIAIDLSRQLIKSGVSIYDRDILDRLMLEKTTQQSLVSPPKVMVVDFSRPPKKPLGELNLDQNLDFEIQVISIQKNTLDKMHTLTIKDQLIPMRFPKIITVLPNQQGFFALPFNKTTNEQATLGLSGVFLIQNSRNDAYLFGMDIILADYYEKYRNQFPKDASLADVKLYVHWGWQIFNRVTLTVGPAVNGIYGSGVYNLVLYPSWMIAYRNSNLFLGLTNFKTSFNIPGGSVDEKEGLQFILGLSFGGGYGFDRERQVRVY